MESKIVCRSYERCCSLNSTFTNMHLRHCNKLCSREFYSATGSRSYQTSAGMCLHLENRGSPPERTCDCPGGRRARSLPSSSWSEFWSPSRRLRCRPALQPQITKKHKVYTGPQRPAREKPAKQQNNYGLFIGME